MVPHQVEDVLKQICSRTRESEDTGSSIFRFTSPSPALPYHVTVSNGSSGQSISDGPCSMLDEYLILMPKHKEDDSQKSAVPPSSLQLGNRAAQRVEHINDHLNGERGQSRPSNQHKIDRSSRKTTMTSLPGVRRIVTDHTADGKAIFGQDEVLRPANPVDPKGGPVPEGR